MHRRVHNRTLDSIVNKNSKGGAPVQPNSKTGSDAEDSEKGTDTEEFDDEVEEEEVNEKPKNETVSSP